MAVDNPIEITQSYDQSITISAGTDTFRLAFCEVPKVGDRENSRFQRIRKPLADLNGTKDKCPDHHFPFKIYGSPIESSTEGKKGGNGGHFFAIKSFAIHMTGDCKHSAFKVKVRVGGVNILHHTTQGKRTQDYFVVSEQKWVWGKQVSKNTARQFHVLDHKRERLSLRHQLRKNNVKKEAEIEITSRRLVQPTGPSIPPRPTDVSSNDVHSASSTTSTTSTDSSSQNEDSYTSEEGEKIRADDESSSEKEYEDEDDIDEESSSAEEGGFKMNDAPRLPQSDDERIPYPLDQPSSNYYTAFPFLSFDTMPGQQPQQREGKQRQQSKRQQPKRQPKRQPNLQKRARGVHTRYHPHHSYRKSYTGTMPSSSLPPFSLPSQPLDFHASYPSPSSTESVPYLYYPLSHVLFDPGPSRPKRSMPGTPILLLPGPLLRLVPGPSPASAPRPSGRPVWPGQPPGGYGGGGMMGGGWGGAVMRPSPPPPGFRAGAPRPCPVVVQSSPSSPSPSQPAPDQESIHSDAESEIPQPEQQMVVGTGGLIEQIVHLDKHPGPEWIDDCTVTLKFNIVSDPRYLPKFAKGGGADCVGNGIPAGPGGNDRGAPNTPAGIFEGHAPILTDLEGLRRDIRSRLEMKREMKMKMNAGTRRGDEKEEHESKAERNSGWWRFIDTTRRVMTVGR